jgi:hypothetical protein
MPKPNPCFIESTIEGGCEGEGECEGVFIIVGTGEGAGEGGVRDDLEFVRFDADLGIFYILLSLLLYF